MICLHLVVNYQVFFRQDEFAGKLDVGQHDDGPFPVGEFLLENALPALEIAFIDQYLVSLAETLLPFAQDYQSIALAGLDVADLFIGDGPQVFIVTQDCFHSLGVFNLLVKLVDIELGKKVSAEKRGDTIDLGLVFFDLFVVDRQVDIDGQGAQISFRIKLLFGFAADNEPIAGGLFHLEILVQKTDIADNTVLFGMKTQKSIKLIVHQMLYYSLRGAKCQADHGSFSDTGNLFQIKD